MSVRLDLFRNGDLASPQSAINRLTRRPLQVTQDIIVVVLIVVLFALMVRTLWHIVKQVREPDLDFRIVISEVLFVLVMVELVRLLQVYLWQHHIAVDTMVEVGIISTLREVVLFGVVDLDWRKIIAIAVLLLALGTLLRFGDLREQFQGRATGPRTTDGERDMPTRSISQPTVAER
jgi:uncharacterized membrane protein (DUF373 family)